MQVSIRSYLTAGVAMVGAGAIALAPIQALPADVAIAADEASSRSVALSAGFDPITPWLEVWNTSEVNVADLVNLYLEAPAPVFQQVIANQLLYLSELPDFGLIADQIVANLGAAIEAPFAEDLTTLDTLHTLLYNILKDGYSVGPIVIIPPVVPEEFDPLLELTTTYLSGALLGIVGPVLGPVIALASSIEGIVENLFSEQPDFVAALNDLVDIPANMVNAYLNGGPILDLTPLVNLLDIQLPDGIDLDSVGLAMGGLLSPGGSLFNSLDLVATVPNIGNLTVPGQGAGTIGSLIELGRTIAQAIGWDGMGNPLQPGIPVPGGEEAEEDVEEAGEPSAAALVSSVGEAPAEEQPASDEGAPAEDQPESDVQNLSRVDTGDSDDDSDGSDQGGSDDEAIDDALGDEESGDDESGGEESGDDELGDDEAGGDELGDDEAGGDEATDDTGDDESGADDGADAGDDADAGDGGSENAA
ncbi:MAG: outer membrane porin GjpA [Actinomycetota bacterium]|nr:outer membrane porin GjpA [Actinomycetota bacterium]